MMDLKEYTAIQKSWCVGRSDGIRRGAQSRVAQCVAWVRDVGRDVGNVLVIGPQHGFELQAFRALGATSIVGVDVVPEFCEDCRALGFECIQAKAESLARLVSGRWNVYASHALEHCEDLAAVSQAIAAIRDAWLYVAVPIEPAGSRDRAHFSSLSREEDLLRHFSTWTMSQRYFVASRETKNTDARYLFT